MGLQDFKNLFMDMFMSPKVGYYNPVVDARIKKAYFEQTGSRLPQISKVERFNPKEVVNIRSPRGGWYTKVNIPPSSKLINANQYIVNTKDIIPYSANNKSLVIMGAKKFLPIVSNPLSVALSGSEMLIDNYNTNKLKQESIDRIKKNKKVYESLKNMPMSISLPIEE